MRYPLAGGAGSLLASKVGSFLASAEGIEAITRSLAMEYAKEGIRFNAVAPGVVDTPLHKKSSREYLESLSPMGTIAAIDDIVEVLFI
jgi:NAD(P)-dependent dehydrogenase (short-subunit alcohol dehydrogenase family)